jgi:hypothetical protein
MKRSHAASLIDELREALATYESDGKGSDLHRRLTDALAFYGIAPLGRCEGEAHSNPFIDNCHRCAPRWGFIGAKEPVT